VYTLPVHLAVFAELFFPDLLGERQDRPGELLGAFLFRSERPGPLNLLALTNRRVADELLDRLRIDAQQDPGSRLEESLAEAGLHEFPASGSGKMPVSTAVRNSSGLAFQVAW
jgi:hypothetical protein